MGTLYADSFKKPDPKKSGSIGPFELNNEGERHSQALVLRYAGCNLTYKTCPLCYAWKYAWRADKSSFCAFEPNDYVEALNNLPEKVKHSDRKKISWVRIQGGEPCLSVERTINTITLAGKALQVVYTNAMNFYECTRAIIQTNGCLFANLGDNDIHNIQKCLEEVLTHLDNGRIVFEVSFKSPNDSTVLVNQIKGFDALLKRTIMPLWQAGISNVAVYPVAGFGPAIDKDNLFLIPIDKNWLVKENKEIPLFHRFTWDKQFEAMFNEFIGSIVPKFDAYKDYRDSETTEGGTKIAIEELEPSGFQKAWISGYAGTYQKYGVNKVEPIESIMRKLCDPDLCPSKWEKWVNSWKGIFGSNPSWLALLNSIPNAKNSDQLLGMVEEMNEYFCPSHPKKHYPYL